MIENGPKIGYHFEIEQNKWYHRIPWVIFYWEQPLFRASVMFSVSGPHLFDTHPLSHFKFSKIEKN